MVNTEVAIHLWTNHRPIAACYRLAEHDVVESHLPEHRLDSLQYDIGYLAQSALSHLWLGFYAGEDINQSRPVADPQHLKQPSPNNQTCCP